MLQLLLSVYCNVTWAWCVYWSCLEIDGLCWATKSASPYDFTPREPNTDWSAEWDPQQCPPALRTAGPNTNWHADFLKTFFCQISFIMPQRRLLSGFRNVGKDITIMIITHPDQGDHVMAGFLVSECRNACIKLHQRSMIKKNKRMSYVFLSVGIVWSLPCLGSSRSIDNEDPSYLVSSSGSVLLIPNIHSWLINRIIIRAHLDVRAPAWRLVQDDASIMTSWSRWCF